MTSHAAAPQLHPVAWPALGWFHRVPAGPGGGRSALPPQQLWDREPFTSTARTFKQKG